MAESGGETKTILICEDDDWLRPILAELLLDEGYRVLETSSGAEAMELVEREGPDVLVLDLQLPWESGLDVLRQLRASAETAGLAVIVVSGALDMEARARLARRTERADGVLEKPLDVGQLCEVVEDVAWSSPSPVRLAQASSRTDAR
jgi:DNA-binding response OmpR family regulator